MNQVSRPTIEIKKWGGESRVGVMARYTASCGTYPTLTVDHVDDIDASEKAAKTSAPQIMQAIGKQQEAAFKGKTTPDVEVEIDAGTTDEFLPSGAEKELKFLGYALGDSYNYNASRAVRSGSAAPQYVEMDALNYTIYTREDKDLNDFDNPPNTIPEIILYVEKILRSSFKAVMEKSIESKQDEKALETMRKIHERNEKLAHYFQQLINDSSDTIGWKKMMQGFATEDRGKNLQSNIAAQVRSVLLAPAGNFLSTIATLASLFQCIYVPDYKGKAPGKLVNRAFLIAGEATELKVKPVALGAEASNTAGILPVSHVYVKAPMCSDQNAFQHNGGINCPTKGPDVGGTAIQIGGPSWWFTDLRVGEEELYMKMAQGGTTGAIKEVKEEQKDTADQIEEDKKQNVTVLQAWGLCHYAWVSLSMCGADIMIPACFGPEIGKRYKVSTEEGELFTGFLRATSTTLSPDSSCLTRLSFSHIICPGFNLPGVDEVEAIGMVQ